MLAAANLYNIEKIIRDSWLKNDQILRKTVITIIFVRVSSLITMLKVVEVGLKIHSVLVDTDVCEYKDAMFSQGFLTRYRSLCKKEI